MGHVIEFAFITEIKFLCVFNSMAIYLTKMNMVSIINSCFYVCLPFLFFASYD